MAAQRGDAPAVRSLAQFNPFAARGIAPVRDVVVGELFASLVTASKVHLLEEVETELLKRLHVQLQFDAAEVTRRSLLLPVPASFWGKYNPLSMARAAISHMAPSLDDWRVWASEVDATPIVGAIRWYPHAQDRLLVVTSPSEVQLVAASHQQRRGIFSKRRRVGGASDEAEYEDDEWGAMAADAVEAPERGSEGGVSREYSHEFQRGVCAVAWKPFSGTVFAVGCENGICIWGGGGTKGQQPVMSFLPCDNGPVHQIEWSPCGLKLASACRGEDGFIVWDVASETPTRVLRAGRTSLLKWSPNGLYLIQGTTSSTMRIWETESWTCEKWSCSGSAKNACWSADSSAVLLSYKDCSYIEMLSLPANQEPPFIGADISKPPVDFGPYSVDVDGERLQVGGAIEHFAWDPLNRRLAVAFASAASDGRHVIALLSTKMPAFTLVPIGYLCGTARQGRVLDVAFRPNHNINALLTVSWEDGSIEFYPLVWTR